MKRNLKLRSITIATLILVLQLTSGCENGIEIFTDSKSQNFSKVSAVHAKKDDLEKSNTEHNNIVPNDENQKEADSDKLSYIRTSSGLVISVPWEKDIDFKKAQEKNGVYVLMSAYCTVLPDPLPGEEENVHVGAKLLTGILVEPGEVFSQNKTIGPYTQARGYKEGPTYADSRITTTTGGGVCKIATTLYNVSVMSNLQIVERHAHSMPVSYVPYGQDATVSYGIKDFQFKNNTYSPILIWTQAIDNILYIGLYGKSKPPKVEWHHEFLETKKTKKIYRINPKLSPGVKKIVVIGMDGAKVKSWVTIEQQNGSVITKQLGKSVYLPLPYIYEKGG